MLKKTFIRLMTPVSLPNWISEIMIAIPRILAGLLLSIDFGSSKFGMPWTDPEKGLSLFEVASWFPEDVAKFGIPFSLAPTFFAWMGAASEAIGGLLLALGFQTRLTGFLISCTMLTAIFFQKWGEGTWGMLPAMGFLWLGIYSMVLGSGKIGLDYWIIKPFKKTVPLKAMAFACILIFGLSSCSTNFATIGIPPQEEFVLGEREDDNFKVQLKNLSNETIQVKAVNKKSGERTQGFGLAAKGETSLYISSEEKVILANTNDKEVSVKAKLNKNVEGMRYQPVSEDK